MCLLEEYALNIRWMRDLPDNRPRNLQTTFLDSPKRGADTSNRSEQNIDLSFPPVAPPKGIGPASPGPGAIPSRGGSSLIPAPIVAGPAAENSIPIAQTAPIPAPSGSSSSSGRLSYGRRPS